MSFTFKWPRFSDEFHRDAQDMLEAALNKGNKPPIIADRIEVIELEMGTQPPELEIRDIGDLTLDQFRGIFRLSYSGDAHIVLRTKVQANPLNQKQPDIHTLGGSHGMLAAHQPLVVPMLLRLSRFVLNAYVVLVVSKQKGITLVFKTDPLQNVDVNSTFDSIAVIQKYIQREIEGQLREMFREDLPGIIHRLSQRWVAGKTKVEAPYLYKKRQHQTNPEKQDTVSVPAMRAREIYHPSHIVGLHPNSLRQLPSRMPSGTRSAPSVIGITSSAAVTSLNNSDSSHESSTTFPEFENFDPTYGLRPDDLPAKSGYSGFGRLFGAPQGLRHLTEDAIENKVEWDEADSFDIVGLEETVSFTPPPSVISDGAPEYETIPAVGGGTITRPRIYHSQSIIRPPTDSSSSSVATITNPSEPNISPLSLLSLSTPGSDRLLVGSFNDISTHLPFQNSYHSSWPNRLGGQTFSHGMIQTDTSDVRFAQHARAASIPGTQDNGMVSCESPQQQLSTDSTFPISSSGGTGSHLSLSSSVQKQEPFTPTHSDLLGEHSPAHLKVSHQHNRRRSLSPGSLRSSEGVSYGPSFNLRSAMDADGNIVLRPGLNNTISQLSTLSHSNHTLSPYTRSLEHFTVRSVPHRVLGNIPTPDRQQIKAKRRRIYRLGAKKLPEPILDLVEQRAAASSPPPPSEFEVSDVEHYFRVPHTDLRQRVSYQNP